MSIFIWNFLKYDILAFVETWISYGVITSWRILVFFLRIILKLYFCMVKYLSFNNNNNCFKNFFNVNGKATVWHVPYLISFFIIFTVKRKKKRGLGLWKKKCSLEDAFCFPKCPPFCGGQIPFITCPPNSVNFFQLFSVVITSLLHYNYLH